MFRNRQPRKSILSLSSENLSSRHLSTPSNFVRLLFGASQLISPQNSAKRSILSLNSAVSGKACRHLRLVSLL